MSIEYHELGSMDVERILSDYYLLERLAADGSRKAREVQRKLEAYAAPRLMRYLSAVCGGEMRHVGGGSGCEGWECNGTDSDLGVGDCVCCDGYDEDDHAYKCDICGCLEYEGCDQDECDCEDESCDGECNYHEQELDNAADCSCYCPYGGMCGACEEAEDFAGNMDHLPGKLADFLAYTDTGSRSSSWEAWHDFHDEHGNIVMKWLKDGFTKLPWVDGYGGDAWGDIARFAWMYGNGEMTAHLFMDRCWTLHHNGGNVFDKMYDPYEIMRLLEAQAAEKYWTLASKASPEVKGLWAIRPYVLADALDRDPAWLGREVPQEVDW